MSELPIHPNTQLGAVALLTPQLERLSDFYQQAIGLELNRRGDTIVHLGVGGRDLVTLIANSGMERAARRRTTGLYHMAILTPSRKELARALRRVAEADWPVQGFADHGVSEAAYLADPDGNGIEIYRDLPREEWPRQVDGALAMVTDPIDLRGVMSELGDETSGAGSQMHPDTRMGHVHLKVSIIAAAIDFYCDTLGFDLVQRYGPSAAFVSAGGYHHHIGLNTWESAGAPPLPVSVAGLRYFTIQAPDATEFGRLEERLQTRGIAYETVDGGLLLRDPAGNGLRIVDLNI